MVKLVHIAVTQTQNANRKTLIQTGNRQTQTANRQPPNATANYAPRCRYNSGIFLGTYLTIQACHS